jgi:type II secretory ATPase GspE/PulE/Tfp pilus assembly ATPase PilB-like protein
LAQHGAHEPTQGSRLDVQGGSIDVLVKKATGTEMKSRAVLDGMGTLRTDGWRRVLRGQTTIEEVLRVTQADDLPDE